MWMVVHTNQGDFHGDCRSSPFLFKLYDLTIEQSFLSMSVNKMWPSDLDFPDSQQRDEHQGGL